MISHVSLVKRPKSAFSNKHTIHTIYCTLQNYRQCRFTNSRKYQSLLLTKNGN